MTLRSTRSAGGAKAHVALRLLMLTLLSGLSCGPGEREFTLLLRDAENRPVPSIEARLAGADRRLGASDEKGRITCMLPSTEGTPIRVRLVGGEQKGGAQYAFAEAYEIDPAALASGVKTIWLDRADKAAETEPSILVVTSDPAGASVVVDGDQRGTTPLRLADVAPGRHQVEVRMAGREPFVWDIVLESGEHEWHAPLVASTSARASVNVVSDPPGAAIRLDGRTTGRETPALLSDLDPGEHRLTLELAGHERWEGTVRLAAGGQAGTGGGILRPLGAPAERTGSGTRPSPPEDATPARAFSRDYLIGTTPGWAEVYLNQETTNRNQAGRFRTSLSGGWNTFRVRNAKSGVDVTLRYEVRADDPNTKLILDYNQARVLPSP